MSDDNDDTPTAQSIRERLLEAHRTGNLIKAVETCRNDDIAEEDVARELAALHNNGTVDIVETFSELRKSEAGLFFFDVLAVFGHALPIIAHDLLPVIRCVRQLVQEAGQDQAARTTISYFITFLEKAPNRLKQALISIKAEPELHGLLPATLVAGCKSDMLTYIEEALLLTKTKNEDMRRQAVLALGQIKWSEENRPSEAVYVALEEILSTDASDGMLATTARTAASLLKHDPSQADRLINLVNSALEKGGEIAVHTAAVETRSGLTV